MPYSTVASTVAQAADELSEVLATIPTRLGRVTEAEASLPRRPGAWSKKEILGHLLDSAANNHHRFVRAQIENSLAMPGYEQNGWVAIQQYRSRSWVDLIVFWTLYNRHLLHLMETALSESLSRPCRIGTGEEVTLEFLMIDYVAHLNHHLAQLLDSSTAR